MTAAELLARLAQRPPTPEALWGPYPSFTESRAALLDRAEFDRALLLDAVEYRYETRKRCDDHLERMIDGQESDEAQYQLDLVEANAASVALRTIVTELRSNP